MLWWVHEKLPGIGTSQATRSNYQGYNKKYPEYRIFDSLYHFFHLNMIFIIILAECISLMLDIYLPLIFNNMCRFKSLLIQYESTNYYESFNNFQFTILVSPFNIQVLTNNLYFISSVFIIGIKSIWLLISLTFKPNYDFTFRLEE